MPSDEAAPGVARAPAVAPASASGELLSPLLFLAERCPLGTAGAGCLEAVLRVAAASARSKSDSLA